MASTVVKATTREGRSRPHLVVVTDDPNLNRIVLPDGRVVNAQDTGRSNGRRHTFRFFEGGGIEALGEGYSFADAGGNPIGNTLSLNREYEGGGAGSLNVRQTKPGNPFAGAGPTGPSPFGQGTDNLQSSGPFGGGGSVDNGPLVPQTFVPNLVNFNDLNFERIQPRDIQDSTFEFTDPFEVAGNVRDFNLETTRRAFDIGLANSQRLIDAEAQSIEDFNPRIGELSREQANINNEFNQQQRIRNVDTALPGAREDLQNQRGRANDLTRGRFSSDIEDRAFELASRSASADGNLSRGFGDDSVVGRQVSDRLSAEQRLGISLQGESLLNQSIAQAQGLILDEPVKVDTTSRLPQSPTTPLPQLADRQQGRIEQANNLNPGQTIGQEIQQQQFSAQENRAIDTQNVQNDLNAQQFNSSTQLQVDLQKLNQDVFNANLLNSAGQQSLNAQADQRRIDFAQQQAEAERQRLQDAQKNSAVGETGAAALTVLLDKLFGGGGSSSGGGDSPSGEGDSPSGGSGPLGDLLDRGTDFLGDVVRDLFGLGGDEEESEESDSGFLDGILDTIFGGGDDPSTSDVEDIINNGTFGDNGGPASFIDKLFSGLTSDNDGPNLSDLLKDGAGEGLNIATDAISSLITQKLGISDSRVSKLVSSLVAGEVGKKGGVPTVPPSPQAAAIQAGSYVGYQQATGISAFLKGEDLTTQEKLALALPTFGASLFSDQIQDIFDGASDALGFGSGKSKDQKLRDSFRDQLSTLGLATQDQVGGLPGNGHKIRLADGSYFDIGKDGKNKIPNAGINIDGKDERNTFDVDFSDQRSQEAVGFANAASLILFGREGQKFVGHLVNAATSNNQSLSATKSNFAYWLNKAGVTKENGTRKLKQLNSQGAISDEDLGAFIAGLNSIYSR